jgi:hypothetical protein
MGSAECLVVIDVREDRSDLRAVANVYRPLPGEKIWFSWEDDPSPGETVIGPHIEGETQGGQPEGRQVHLEPGRSADGPDDLAAGPSADLCESEADV